MISAKNSTGKTNCAKNPNFVKPLRRNATEAAIAKAENAGIHKYIWYIKVSGSIVRGNINTTMVIKGITDKQIKKLITQIKNQKPRVLISSTHTPVSSLQLSKPTLPVSVIVHSSPYYQVQ